MYQALVFTSDFKLGHYMKIPPRPMFWAQVLATAIAGTVQLGGFIRHDIGDESQTVLRFHAVLALGEAIHDHIKQGVRCHWVGGTQHTRLCTRKLAARSFCPNSRLNLAP